MKAKFISLSIEIACIFIAVTLSFYLDDVRENRNEKQDIREIIASLVGDIEIYTIDMSNGSQYASNVVDTIDKCLQMSLRNERIEGQLRNDFLYYISDVQSFSPSESSAYVGLLSSSVWQQLPDSARRSIFNLYEISYKAVERTRNNYASNNLYVRQHYFPKFHLMFYTSQKGNDERFGLMDSLNFKNNFALSLMDPEFRSMLVNARNLANSAIVYQRTAKQEGEAAIAILKHFLEEY
ncbi:hypothetical protein WBG78_04975 [Chryseolinea sp. T2]|uniref:hypothetical protein n=1 Tax=Chryseolinea sp. T2 TaxID=3129255 RepID=UPI003076CDD4